MAEEKSDKPKRGLVWTLTALATFFAVCQGFMALCDGIAKVSVMVDEYYEAETRKELLIEGMQKDIESLKSHNEFLESKMMSDAENFNVFNATTSTRLSNLESRKALSQTTLQQ